MQEREDLNFIDLIPSIESNYDNLPTTLDTALISAFRDVLVNVKQYQKSGSISLEIGIKPINDVQISVSAKIKTKVPVASTPAKTIYMDKHGRVVLEDPRQRKLEFQEQPQLQSIKQIKAK